MKLGNLEKSRILEKMEARPHHFQNFLRHMGEPKKKKSQELRESKGKWDPKKMMFRLPF